MRWVLHIAFILSIGAELYMCGCGYMFGFGFFGWFGCFWFGVGFCFPFVLFFFFSFGNSNWFTPREPPAPRPGRYPLAKRSWLLLVGAVCLFSFVLRQISFLFFSFRLSCALQKSPARSRLETSEGWAEKKLPRLLFFFFFPPFFFSWLWSLNTKSWLFQ